LLGYSASRQSGKIDAARGVAYHGHDGLAKGPFILKSKIGVNILMTAMVGGAIAFLVWTRLPPWTWVQTVGACCATVGFVLWTLARFQLGASFAVTAQAKQLVTRGLYSKLRNPIYYFGSLTIAGLILLVGRPLWLLVFAIVVPLQMWRIGTEARVLEAKFGEEYRTYRAKTWI
jgi:protein-S-isoprenylcysteine O-methyltransferase Ste14